ncbi:AraC family transcriptional regulator [Photobacterium satsumensis]|uniref:AraC family transcriptional regulator n=1 Tax=Photobacterium satsumensis TaxID=2910239 RepID=UPI003D0C7A0B
MKPYIEKVSPDSDRTWRLEHYLSLEESYELCCGWHYHHEYELVLCHDPGGALQCTAVSGDHCYEQAHNTLVLYGPGLPHMMSGHVHAQQNIPVSNHILWFDPRWIKSLFQAEPALQVLENTLERSKNGIKFSQQCSEQVSALLRETQQLTPARQFNHIVNILLCLAEDDDAQSLASTSYTYHLPDDSGSQLQRLKKLQNYIEKNYQMPIKIAEICDELHMSESSVYRLFERHFMESFAEHLKRYRIGKACEKIINTQQPIALIAEQTGFANLSNFNRQFKQQKQMTPSQFRSMFRQNLRKKKANA